MSAVDKYYACTKSYTMQSTGRKRSEGFPDSHTTVEHMIAEDNLVMAFLKTTATQTGEYLGAQLTNKRLL